MEEGDVFSLANQGLPWGWWGGEEGGGRWWGGGWGGDDEVVMVRWQNLGWK